MKKTYLKGAAVAVAAIVLSGCASSATNDRIAALESQVADAARAADQALDLARQAQSSASGSSSDISEAQRLARQALDTATETAERLARMEDECCGGK